MFFSCPRCAQTLKSNAACCPNCGHELPKEDKKGRMPLWWIIVLVGFAAFIFFTRSNDKSESPEPDAQPVVQQDVAGQPE